MLNPTVQETVDEIRDKTRTVEKRNEKKDSSKKSNHHQKYSAHFSNGVMIETTYDKEAESTDFVIFQNGEVSKYSSYQYKNKLYAPPPADNTLVVNQFVKLPSDVAPYESEEVLIQEVQAFIRKYVQIPKEFAQLATFYVLLTWVFDAFEELPYIRVIGDFGSGKSRFLKVMGALTYKAVFLNGAASSSAIFRMIDDIRGTVILDEADFRNSDTTNEIVKILNSGFQKGIPVFRSEAKGGKNKSFDPIPFNVFSPKVLATRNKFRDEALESRCLSASMEELTRTDIPENLDESFEIEAQMLRNKLLMFRLKRMSKGITKKKLPNLDIEPRLKQIVTPLYSIMESDNARAQIVDFIHHKQNELYEDRYNSTEGEVLRSLIALREENEVLSVKNITEKFNGKYSSGYSISPKRVGSIVGNIFHLEKKRRRTGTVIIESQENAYRLQKLAVKYGIEKPSVNDVNLVNVTQENYERTKKMIENIFNESDQSSTNNS